MPDAPPFLLMRRVDAFTYAAKARLEPEQLARLRAAQAKAESDGRPSVASIGRDGRRMDFACSNRGGPAAVMLQNADVQIRLTPEASHGWTIEIRVFAAFLATHPFEDAIRLARLLALELGEVTDERCRRLDLAADFEDWPLDDELDQGWVTKKGARRERFRPTAEERSDEPETRLHAIERNVTGVAVCYGGPIMARVYDKTRHLEHLSRRDKREMEESAWSSAGWRGGAVTRVEYQIRTEVLHELGVLSNLDELPARLDAIWSYCTRKWLTLHQATGATRLYRAPMDPRWEAVQAVVWLKPQDPAKRSRKRGGSPTEQAFGCVLSNLASFGHLATDALEGRRESAEKASQMKPGTAATYVRRRLHQIAMAFILIVESSLLASHGQDARAAAVELVEREEATAARFSTADSWLQSRLNARGDPPHDRTKAA